MGYQSEASQIDATSIGAYSKATGNAATALGKFARASATGSIAIGADGTDADPVGAFGAEATGVNSMALGVDSMASASNSIAMGNRAVANRSNSTAVGSFARVTGLEATAVGYLATATGDYSVALGQASRTTGIRGTAVGPLASTANGVALGVGANASGNVAIAVGRNTIASAGGAAALGDSARAAFAGSTALGRGATTTRNHQVRLGGTGSSVSVGDMTTSTAAQVGDIYLVTVDSSGTLGRQSTVVRASAGSGTMPVARLMSLAELLPSGPSQAEFDTLSGRVDTLEGRMGSLEGAVDRKFRVSEGGIAAAMALGGTMIVPDSTISLNFNLATYRGEQGFAGTIAARVAERIYLSGGVADSSVKGSSGGRVGVAFGF